jgi:nucleosome binding factor SPN SPT16 subunit
MGLEFQELAFSIKPKNERTVKPNQLYNVSVGFSNLELSSETDSKKKVYGLLLVGLQLQLLFVNQ